MSRIKAAQAGPDPKVVKACEAAGATVVGVIAVPVGAVDWDASTLLQVRGEGVDFDTVERYAGRLVAGDDFPHGIVRVSAGGDATTGPFQVIDGAHRFHAASAAELDTFQGLLVEASDAEAVEIAVRVNAAHGRPLSADDRAAQAVALIAAGATQAKAGQACGLSQRQVSEAVELDAAAAVAADVGCAETFAGLKPTARRHAARLHERPPLFAAAVELAAMGPKVADLGDTVFRALTFDNDRQALEEIGDAIDVLEERQSRPQRAQKASASRQVTALLNILAQLSEIDPDVIAGGLTSDAARRMPGRLVDAGRKIMAIHHAVEHRSRRPAA